MKFFIILLISQSAVAGHMVKDSNFNCKCVEGNGLQQCSRIGEVFDSDWNKQCAALYNAKRSGSVNVFGSPPKK